MYEDDITETFPEDVSCPVYRCMQVVPWPGRNWLWLLAFGMCLHCGFFVPYLMSRVGREDEIAVITRSCQIGAVVTAIITLSSIIRWILLWKLGSEVKAKVCAYEEIENALNGTKKLYMKLLVNRPDGDAHVLWKVKSHNDLYFINSDLTVKAFKYDCALVKAKKQNKMNYCGTAGDLINLSIMADLEHSPDVLLKNHRSAFDDLGIAIMSIALCFVSTVTLALVLTQHMAEAPFVAMLMIPLGVIGWSLLFKCLMPAFHYLQLKWMGRQVPARVWDYAPTNVIVDGAPIWKVKVLTYTEDGYRFLTFSVGSQKQPYEKDAIIELRVYKDYVLQERK